MNKTIISAAIIGSLVIGFGGGFGISIILDHDMHKDLHHNHENKKTHDEKDHSHNQSHMHSETEIDTTLPEPKVSISITEDKKSGYNLRLTIDNFKFTPEKASLEDQTPNEGHAHLYINDKKIARIYGEWYHIDSNYLMKESNTVTVTLNANDHSDWVKDGKHIQDVTTIMQ